MTALGATRIGESCFTLWDGMGGRGVAVWLLGLSLWIVGPAAAQEPAPADTMDIRTTASDTTTAAVCTEALAAAEAAYLNREYATAVAEASACAERRDASDDDRVAAYRLMGLAFLRQNALAQARSALISLLSIDPTYAADPVSDPPAYALFVSMVRQDVRPEAQVGATPLAPPSDGVNGIRIRFRDRGFERLNGIKMTLWRPRDANRRNGWINGLSIGVPLGGASRVRGIGVGVIGIDGRKTFRGIGVGGIGLAAGRYTGIGVAGLGQLVRERFTGIGASGLGATGRGSLRGLMIGGLGQGVAGSISGLQVGGLGVIGYESIRGISVGGLGVGSWQENVYGVQAAGLGVGARGNIAGITVGPAGVLSGGAITGLTTSGVFIGAAGRIRGVQVAGATAFGAEVQGITVAPVVAGGTDIGLIAAPAYYRGGRDGSMTGLSISTFNHVRGEQRGLTIGLFNYARTLSGVQIGVLNYAANNPTFLQLVPGVNLNL